MGKLNVANRTLFTCDNLQVMQGINSESIDLIYLDPPKVRGRPPENEWPEQIPDTPENIAKAILNTPPKKDDEWEYMNRHKRTEK